MNSDGINQRSNILKVEQLIYEIMHPHNHNYKTVKKFKKKSNLEYFKENVQNNFHFESYHDNKNGVIL